MGTPANMRDCGWVWEGQPAYLDFPPSMYGLGEGCAYFGLSQAYYLYHGNNALALAKLAHLRQVICDTSIWRYRKVQDAEGHVGWGIYHDMALETAIAEAATVSRLSRQFPNVVGIMQDDFAGAAQTQGYTGADAARIHRALRSENPGLKLWVTVYTHELDPERWEPFMPAVDGVFLWTWQSEHLVDLDAGVTRCREVFPGRPVVLGCYMRDYTLQEPVPMDRLRYQWERIPGYLERGLVDGFCILGAYLIERQPEHAAWIRDFIAAH